MGDVTGTYEMLWDCAACGTRGLLGKTHRHCPACGAAQDPAQRYFPEPGKETEVVNYTYVGADRKCASCDSPNPAAASHCVNCGAPLDGGVEVARLMDDAAPGMKVGQRRVEPAAAVPPRKHTGWKILFALVALFVLFLLVSILWKKEVTVEVTAHEWSRAIAIEELHPVQRSAWCDQMPNGAYGVSSKREQRSTNRIADGEECTTSRRDNGDGTFSNVRDCRTKYREEPVYDRRCYFTVDEWTRTRTVDAAGMSLFPGPRWPEVRLTRSGNCRGCEREGARTEKYVVKLKGDAGNYSCEVDSPTWSRHKDGDRVRMKVHVVGGGAVCSSLVAPE